MTETDSKPPARSIFRKLAAVIAAISFLMAIVGGLGLIDKDGRLFHAMSFLFVGFMFSTIAIQGCWPPRPKQDGKPVDLSSTPQVFLTLVIMCFMILLMGIGGLISAKPHGFVARMLDGAMVFFGGIGIISGSVAFLQARRKKDEPK